MKAGFKIHFGDAGDFPVGPFQQFSDLKRAKSNVIGWGKRKGLRWGLPVAVHFAGVSQSTSKQGTRLRVQCDQQRTPRQEDRMKNVDSESLSLAKVLNLDDKGDPQYLPPGWEVHQT